MDNKLIRQYGQDILCYRIRTARRRIRMQYEDFDKWLLKLHREEKKLIQQERDLGWEEIAPPYQRGWKRTFVLREDVAQSKYADFFEGILSRINTVEWSHKKDFKIKKRVRGRKVYVVKPQKLEEHSSWYFKRLNFSGIERMYFSVEPRVFYGKYVEFKYVFIQPWRYTLKVSPNMVRRIKRKDSDIRSRLKEIDNYMDWDYHQCRRTKLLMGNTYGKWKDFEKYKEKNFLKNKPLPRILDEAKEEV